MCLVFPNKPNKQFDFWLYLRENLMSKKIKLIWDFRGSVSEKTAQHHEMHLREYIISENLDGIVTGYSSYGQMHTIVFMVVPEDDLMRFRDALKPHRGEVYAPENG